MLAAVSLSISDTKTTLKKFNLDLKTVVERHKAREMEYYGQVTESCFTPEDIKEIHKRRRQYKGVIFLKCLFIVILLASLASAMTSAF